MEEEPKNLCQWWLNWTTKYNNVQIHMCNFVATVGKSIYLRNVLQLSKFMVNFPSAVLDAFSSIKCLAKERKKTIQTLSTIYGFHFRSFYVDVVCSCNRKWRKMFAATAIWLWSLPNDAKMEKKSSSSSFEIDAKMNRSIYTHIKKNLTEKPILYCIFALHYKCT